MTLLFLSQTAVAKKTQFYLQDQLDGELMAKVYVIGETDQQQQVQKSLYTAVDHARRFLKTIDRKDPQSEISRLNQMNVKGVFPISPELARGVETGIEISKKSNGMFDVTSASNTPLYKKVSLKNGELKLGSEGIVLTLDNITEGLLADLIADDLNNAGWSDALVKVGGAYVSRGSDSQGPWNIPIVVPGSTRAKRVIYYKAKDGASGATWKKSVTVFAPTGAKALGYANALHRMGIEEAKKFIAGHKELRAVFIDSQGNVTHIPKFR